MQLNEKRADNEQWTDKATLNFGKQSPQITGCEPEKIIS